MKKEMRFIIGIVTVLAVFMANFILVRSDSIYVNRSENITYASATTNVEGTDITENREVKQNLQNLINYTGTSKVADRIKKEPWVDIRTFGAKGDAIVAGTVDTWTVSGTNNAQAFKDAIASLNGKPGTIFIPPGDYGINSPNSFADAVQIPVGVNIVAVDAKVRRLTQRDTNGATPYIMNFQGENTVLGLHSDGGLDYLPIRVGEIKTVTYNTGTVILTPILGSTEGEYSHYIDFGTSGENIVFVAPNLQNIPGSGISPWCNKITIVNGVFGEYGDHVVYFGQDSQKAIINNCKFTTKDVRNTRPAIKSRAGIQGYHITNNTIDLIGDFVACDSWTAKPQISIGTSDVVISKNIGNCAVFFSAGGEGWPIPGELSNLVIDDNTVKCTTAFNLGTYPAGANQNGVSASTIKIQDNKFDSSSYSLINGHIGSGIKSLELIGNSFKNSIANPFILIGDIGYFNNKGNHFSTTATFSLTTAVYTYNTAFITQFPQTIKTKMVLNENILDDNFYAFVNARFQYVIPPMAVLDIYAINNLTKNTVNPIKVIIYAPGVTRPKVGVLMEKSNIGFSVSTWPSNANGIVNSETFRNGI